MAANRITIEVDNHGILEALQGADRRLERPHELMRLIAGNMQAAVEDNFDQQGRPQWVGLKPETVAQREKSGHWPGRILQRTGRLKNSISQFWDDRQAIVGTNVIYAAIQHFGGKTKPHVIVPRHRKALSFGGRVLKSVKHPGSHIPARPFLHMTEQDMADLREDVGAWYIQTLRP